MNRLFLVSALLVCSLGMWAQGVVRGKVLDKQNDEVLQFVTVRVTGADGKLAGGGMTDVKGQFNIQGLKDGAYTLEITLMGYKSAVRRFQVTPEKRNIHYNAIYLSEDQKMLKEVQVTGQRSQMKLEVDRKTFTVDEVLAAAGGFVSDLLENIPPSPLTRCWQLLVAL